MNPVGLIVMILGFLMLFGNDTEPQKNSIPEQLTDSFNAELAELDRMEQQLREAVKR